VKNKIKVLVVDDEEGMRETLSTIFEKKGYLVSLASTGGIAFDSVKKEFFNLVVLDMKLPDVNGIEVLKRIKKRIPGYRNSDNHSIRLSSKLYPGIE
jgi:CheY-like chemotaxis protein